MPPDVVNNLLQRVDCPDDGLAVVVVTHNGQQFLAAREGHVDALQLAQEAQPLE